MCMTCVATGSAYVVPAVVGLRVYAGKLRRRRLVVEDRDPRNRTVPSASPPSA